MTVMACAPGWDDYFNLNETLPEMVQRLMDEDGQQMGLAPRGGTAIQKDDSVKIVAMMTLFLCQLHHSPAFRGPALRQPWQLKQRPDRGVKYRSTP